MLSGSKLTTMAGSAYYIAPEVLNNCYGMEADMWSVGVILYILLCGLPPFWADKEEGIFEAIKTGKIDVFSGIWEGISQDAKDIVLRMLTRDPSKRITPEKALGTPLHSRYSYHAILVPVPAILAQCHLIV